MLLAKACIIYEKKITKYEVDHPGHLAPHMGQDAHTVGILPQWSIFCTM